MVRLCPVQINFYDLMLDVIGQMALRDYSRAFLEKIENLYGWAFMAKIWERLTKLWIYSCLEGCWGAEGPRPSFLLESEQWRQLWRLRLQPPAWGIAWRIIRARWLAEWWPAKTWSSLYQIWWENWMSSRASWVLPALCSFLLYFLWWALHYKMLHLEKMKAWLSIKDIFIIYCLS